MADPLYNPFLGPPPPADPARAAALEALQHPTLAFTPRPPSTIHNQEPLLSLAEQAQLEQTPKLAGAPPSWITDRGPRSYDLTDPSDHSRLDLSLYEPGDVLHTPGADVQILPSGRPMVTLRPGYGNGRSAAGEGPVLVPPGPSGVSADSNMAAADHHSPSWFLNMVPNRHPWDYKQQSPRYEAFGNFNYGAAGRASRLPDWVLQRGAGWAQQRAGASRPEFGSPYLGTGSFGDDPIDQYWIEQGVRYHDKP